MVYGTGFMDVGRLITNILFGIGFIVLVVIFHKRPKHKTEGLCPFTTFS